MQWKRWLTVAGLCLGLGLALVSASFADEPAVTTRTATASNDGVRVHRLASEFQAQETEIRVLMPTTLAAGEKLRVLYLLPVEAGTEHRYGDAVVEAQRLRLADKHRVICVAPTFSQLPWFADHPTDLKIRQESHFLKVVLPTVERLYPALAEREGRILIGFSKSGYGAWSLLLRHPDLFVTAVAWDAPLMKTAPNQFGMGPIYGTPENFEHYRIDRLLRTRAADFRPKANEQPRSRLIHLGYGNFRDHHQRAESLLNELQIPHTYADGPQREHTWHSGWLEEAATSVLK